MGFRLSQWRSPILWSVVLGVSTQLSGCGKPPVTQGQTPPAVPVKLETLEEDLVQTVTEYVGVLEADELVTLRAKADGTVRRILIQEGDFIEVGTAIAQLQAERDQASVQQAIANVEAAKAAEANAEAQLSAVQAEKTEAEADLKLQRQDLARIKSLVDSGALPAQRLDQSQRDVAVAEARVETINKRITAARASINQAQANQRQVNTSVAIAVEDLQDTQITAPVAGKIGDLAVKEGDYVEQGDTIGTITQNQNLQLNFFVPIEQAPQLRLNVPVELIDYRTLNTIGKGTVSFISPEVDFTSQTILAKASFENPDNRLFTGQLVKAKVIWRQQFGVSVPVTAISRVGGETFIFVAEPNPNADSADAPPFIAVQKAVKLGDIEGDRQQVLEGLSVGDRIVTTGILNLNDGAPITQQTEEGFAQ